MLLIKREHAVGEKTLTRLSLDFNKSCKFVTDPESMTDPDCGPVAVRETMERLGIVEFTAPALHDPGNTAHIPCSLRNLPRFHVRMSAQGCRDHDDATRIGKDSELRISCNADGSTVFDL